MRAYKFHEGAAEPVGFYNKNHAILLYLSYAESEKIADLLNNGGMK